jgi:hypothetical protein
MVRHLLAVAAAVALLSTGALAQDFDAGSKTVIHKSTADGMGSKKVIIKRHGDGFGASKKVVIKRHDAGDLYGGTVTKKKIIRGEGMYGSSMPERTVIKRRTITSY